MSQFNLENVTILNTKAEDYEKNRKMVCYYNYKYRNILLVINFDD